MRDKRYSWLAGIINDRNYTIGAEIGVATGNTTTYLLSHCPRLQRLFVIDDWRPVIESEQWNRLDMEAVFREKVNGDSRVWIHKGISWEVAFRVPDKSLDFVFIDASHDYNSVVKDLFAWGRKVKQGGLICGHDYHVEGVHKALTEVIGAYIATGVDHVWYKEHETIS